MVWSEAIECDHSLHSWQCEVDVVENKLAQPGVCNRKEETLCPVHCGHLWYLVCAMNCMAL